MNPDSGPFDVSPDEVDNALQALWSGRSGEFENLLGSGSGDSPAVEVLFGNTAHRTMINQTTADTPPSIPNYQLNRELGRGGMGIVYEADQLHPRRTVALKVTRGSAAPKTPQFRLFEREIQTLARLKHPNIAALHEAGLTEDGRPYYAMELVRGRNLKDYLRDLDAAASSRDSRKLRPQLALFGKICNAISYAHQRGVLHRDLKPSNILISDDDPSGSSRSSAVIGPEVKVLDFGLARLTDDDAETITTDVGQIRGTLAYMSPEQIQGVRAEIDTRSDVYALGVILYEMLTGRLPYDIKQASIAQAARTICETPPMRPTLHQPHLPRDLETIILKSLSKDREHRYQSVGEFADDIDRFLNDQPILARPHSTIYQLRKLMARHRLASGALALVVAMAVVASVVSTYALLNTRAARQSENEQRLVAESVNQFLVDTFSHIDPRKAKSLDTTLLREILGNAAARIEIELKDQPKVRATLEGVIGQTYQSLGIYDLAQPHLERALSASQSAFGPDHARTLTAMNNLATLSADQGRLDEALKMHEQTLEARLRTLGEQNPDTLFSMNNLGDLYRERGRLAEAETLLRKTVELRRRLLGDQHPETLVSINNLGTTCFLQGKNVDAEKLLRESLEGQLRLLASDHPDVLVSKNDLATVLKRIGKRDEAESLYREVADGFTRQFGEGHMDTLIVRFNLEGLERERLSPADAVSRMADLTAIAESHLPSGHYLTSVFRSTWARRLYEGGQFDQAAPIAVRAFEELKSSMGPSHLYTKQSADTVADIYEALQKPELASPYRALLQGE